MSTSKSLYKEYLEALAVAVIVAVILRMFVLQAFRIPTGSMKDTLLVGDFLLVNKFIYGMRTPDRLPGTNVEIPYIRFPAFKQPGRGDIIIFEYPKDKSVDYIKRCIGLPGDTVEIRNNTVFINGKPEGVEVLVDTKYDRQEEAAYAYYRIKPENGAGYTIRKRADGRTSGRNYGPVVVPPGHYFMMGDNRDNSSDSRYWGFVPQSNILGKALIIYFSFDKYNLHPKWNVFAAIRWNRIFNIIR